MRELLAMIIALGAALPAFAGGTPVTYQADGRMFEGYFAGPTEDTLLVVLVHDWDGLTDYEMKRADMLADLGYAVFAVDLFGAGVRPQTVEECQKLTGELYADRATMRKLLYAGLQKGRALAGDPPVVVAIGYCFGGACVLELARSGANLDAFVTFHGGLATPDGQDYSRAKGQYLVFHGSADQSVSLENFAALARELEAAGLPHEMTTYGGAPHAFTVFGTERYREDADRRSWRRFTGFLKEMSER